MKNDMKYVKLEEISDIIMGQSPDSKYYNEEGFGYPFLQGCANFTSKYPRAEKFCSVPSKIAPKKSILISVRAPVGDLNLSDMEYCIGRGLASIVPIDVDLNYLFYSLNFNKRNFNRISQGSTFDAINSQDLRQFKVLLPIDKRKEKRISEILLTIDKSIENTEKLIDKYKNIKQGLMQDLFSRGIQSGGTIRPSYKEASNLYNYTDYGFLPKGWEVGTFADLAEINPAKIALKLSDEDLVTFIAMEDLSEEGKVINKLVRQFKQVKSGYTQFVENDILFAKITPCMENGKGGLVTKLNNGIGYGSTEFHIIRTKDIKLLFFLYQYTLYKPFRAKAEMQMTGSAGQQRVPKDFFERYQIPIPPLEEQVMIGNILNRFDSKIDKEQKYYNKLILIKQGLMQDLLTGKVRVKVEGD